MKNGVNKTILTTLFFLIGSLFSISQAQEENNVLGNIQTQSAGNVEFDIPDKISNQIVTTPAAPSGKKKPAQSGQGYSTQRPSKGQGFRIQVFCDGGNQSTLQARAKARCNAIASRFPKYRGQVYTFSSAPNWYGRVGNFRTQAEANAALSELKKAFPAFASEMRVVKSKISTR